MNLLDDLLVLGSTADDVANSLRKLDIRGDIGEPGSCPIAVHLKSKGYDSPEVMGTEVACDGNASVPAPDPIREFVGNFDNWEYPDLSVSERPEPEPEW